MEADTLNGTCSMAELHDLDAVQDVAEQIDDCGGTSEPATIANLNVEQMKNKALLAGLAKCGFKKFGTYNGRGGRQITVFMRGVTKSRG